MINKKGGCKPIAQLHGGSILHTDAFCKLLPRPRPVKAILPRESEEVRAGLSIWFYIYKDQMASLEMIFDPGTQPESGKDFFFCSLFNLLSVYGRGLSCRSRGELCVRLSGQHTVGLGVSPSLPEGAAERCGRVGLVVKPQAGLSGVEGRAGSCYTTAPQLGNLRQQPLAWNIIKHTQALRNRNATN